MVDNLPALSMTADPVRFADVASNLFSLAKAMAGSQLVPKAFQGRPDDITAAWLMGMELDLPPMTSLLNIHVIEGRAALSANAMRGIAMSKGVVYEVISSSDTRVQMRAKAPGQHSWTEVDWPIERAKKMELTTKKNWIRMPQAMLMARATSEVTRLVASNVLMGMPYSVEELRDEVEVSEEAAQPKMAAAPAVKRRRLKPVPAPQEEPDLTYPEPQPRRNPAEDEVPPWDEPAPEAWPDTPAIGAGEEPRAIEAGDDEEKITDATRKAIMAGFNEIGTRDRAERLTRVSAVVGREVHSVNMLTETEGRRVVARLQQAREEQAG